MDGYLIFFFNILVHIIDLSGLLLNNLKNVSTKVKFSECCFYSEAKRFKH